MRGCLCPLSTRKSLLPLKYGNRHSPQIAPNLLDKVIRNVLGQNLNLLTELLNSLIVQLGVAACAARLGGAMLSWGTPLRLAGIAAPWGPGLRPCLIRQVCLSPW